MDDRITEITVMCDYSADGIWANGGATDLELIAEELNMPYNSKWKSIQNELYDWQSKYENFDFWSDKADYEKTYNTQEFKKFLEQGKKIAFEVRDIIPNNIDVIYFSEGRPNARYCVNTDGTMTLKEKYD
jgi:hypothetical protein